MNCFLLPIFVASFFMIGTAYGIPLTPEDTELNSELISYFFSKDQLISKCPFGVIVSIKIPTKIV